MATFPTGYDNITMPGAGDSLSGTTVLHHLQHDSANSAISAIEYILGINGTTTATQLQYKISALGVSASSFAPFTSTALYNAGHQHSKRVTGITANGTASFSFDLYHTSGTVTAMLFGAAGSGRTLWFKNLSGTAVISASGTDKIDGLATAGLSANYQKITLVEGASGAWDIF